MAQDKWYIDKYMAKLKHGKVRRGLRAVGQLVSGIARINAPHDTGTLEDSIGFRFGDDGQSVLIYVGVEYGLYQEKAEFNVGKKWKGPYLRPAVDDNHEAINYVFNRA